MVRVVSSVEELVKINEEQDHYTQTLGVGFLLIADFKSLREFHKSLKVKGFPVYYAEDFVEEGKSWLSTENVISIVRKLMPDKDYAFLFSLDNLLRLYSKDDFNSTTSALLRERTSKQGRLFLVLSGLRERLNDFADRNSGLFYEIKHNLDPEKVKVLVVNPSLKAKDSGCIKDFKSYLSMWKLEKEEYIVCVRSVFSEAGNAHPDSAVMFEHVEDWQTYLRVVKKFKDKVYVSYEGMEKDLVDRGVGSFEDIVKKCESFKDWLLGFLRLKPEEKLERYSYLNYAYHRFSDYANILSEDGAVQTMLNIYRSEFLDKKEKIELLSACLEKEPYLERELCRNIEISGEKESFLGILDCEKEKLIELYSKGSVGLEDLRSVQELDFYPNTPLPSNIKEKQRWVLEYFELYKISKLSNKIDEKLRIMLDSLNAKDEDFFKWFYSFDRVVNLVEELKEKVDEVIFIDALGFEWAGFVSSYLEHRGLKTGKLFVARSELPSITEVNRPSVKEAYREFDMLAHEQYQYPKTLLVQMKTLKSILDRLSPERSYLIFGDHGLSALCRLEEGLGLKGDFGHYGRYSKDKVFHNRAIEYKDVWVARTWRCFGKRPISEVHGGALPEEVLTFLLLVNVSEERKYRLILPEKEIDRRHGKLVFFVEPRPKVTPVVYLDGKRVDVYTEGESFYVKVQKTGVHLLEVEIEGRRIKENFKVKGGFEEEDIL